MPNTPKDIIIQSAKIDRIDTENVVLSASASVLDDESNTIPNVKVALIVNRKEIGNLTSDEDGFVDINQSLGLKEDESLSIQVKDAVSGVRSKIKLLSEKCEKNNSNLKSLDEINKQTYDNALIELHKYPSNFKNDNFNAFRANKVFVLKAIELNPLNYEYISSELKNDEEIIKLAINGNIDVVNFLNYEIIIKENVIEILKKHPEVMSKIIGKISLCFVRKINDEFLEKTFKGIINTGDINFTFLHRNIVEAYLFYDVPTKYLMLVLEHPDLNIIPKVYAKELRKILIERGIDTKYFKKLNIK